MQHNKPLYHTKHMSWYHYFTSIILTNTQLTGCTKKVQTQIIFSYPCSYIARWGGRDISLLFVHAWSTDRYFVVEWSSDMLIFSLPCVRLGAVVSHFSMYCSLSNYNTLLKVPSPCSLWLMLQEVGHFHHTLHRALPLCKHEATEG